MPLPQPLAPDALLHAPSLKSGIVAGLVAHAAALGEPFEDWFAGMRLDARAFVAPSPLPYLSYREACQVLQRGLAALPGDGHGLELGERQGLADFGLIGLAMLASADFGEALHVGIRYAPITGAMLDLSLDEGDRDGIAVVMRMRTHEPAIEAYLCEEFIASCLGLCRGLLGGRFGAARVDLAYPAPDHACRYGIAFDTTVAFDRPDSRVVIDRRWLQQPMPAANADSARQLRTLCQAQMPSGQPPAGIVATLEQRIALQVAGNPRLTDLAAELHLTERTLRRQLRAAGTHFRELLDQARKRVALDLLADPSHSMTQVATAVGFRDVRDFRRAFKRWTGALPGGVRAGQHQPQADAAG